MLTDWMKIYIENLGLNSICHAFRVQYFWLALSYLCLMLARLYSLLFFGFCLILPVSAQNYDCEEELFSKKDKKTRLFGYVNAIGEYRIQPVFLKALPFVGKNAIVQQGKKFGVINCEGVLVVPADFDEIASFSNGKGWVKAAGKWGLMDARGKMLIAPTYEEVKEINMVSGQSTWVKKAGKWGLISKENGRFIVQPTYDDISNLSDSAGIGRLSGFQDLVYYGDGRVIISQMRQVVQVSPSLFLYKSKEGFSGAFNSLAFILIRPEWDFIRPNRLLLVVGKGAKRGLRGLRGQEILPCIYDSITPFEEGYTGVLADKIWRIATTAGKFLEGENRFSFLSLFKGGIAMAGLPNSAGLGVFDIGKKSWLVKPDYPLGTQSADGQWLGLRSSKQEGWRLFDIPSRTLVLTNFDSVATSDLGPVYRAYKAGKATLTSRPAFTEGEYFDQIDPIFNTYYLVKKGAQYGVLSKSSIWILTPEWDEIVPFTGKGGRFFKIGRGGNWGVADEKGKVICNPQFAHLHLLEGQTLAASKNKDGRNWGLYTFIGQVLGEAKYDSIRFKTDHNEIADFPVLAYRKSKAVLLNKKGEEQGEPIKGHWAYLGDGVWLVKNQPNMTLLDGSGKKLSEAGWEDIGQFSEGLCAFKVAGKWGFVNAFGRVVIPHQYEEVTSFVNGLAYIKSGGKWGVLKRNGSWLVQPVGIGVETDSQGKRKLVLP